MGFHGISWDLWYLGKFHHDRFTLCSLTLECHGECIGELSQYGWHFRLVNYYNLPRLMTRLILLVLGMFWKMTLGQHTSKFFMIFGWFICLWPSDRTGCCNLKIPWDFLASETALNIYGALWSHGTVNWIWVRWLWCVLVLKLALEIIWVWINTY